VGDLIVVTLSGLEQPDTRPTIRHTAGKRQNFFIVGTPELPTLHSGRRQRLRQKTLVQLVKRTS
jgi:hypothetical protein